MHTTEEQAITEETQVTPSLNQVVTESVSDYFTQLGNNSANNLYDMLLAEVEEPLLRKIMDHTKFNQSKAAIILGLSRGTLRKKLKAYDIITKDE